PELRRLGISWPVTLQPGIGHIPLTLEQDAITTAVQAVEKLTQ
ncbi:MAG: alpha/beta hydrolase, partial [Aeromonas veronii]